MSVETMESELIHSGEDRQAVISDAAGIVLERSTMGPTPEDDLWEEAIAEIIATD